MNSERNQSLTADIAAVCKRIGLDALTVDADEAEVRRQEDGAAVGFLKALEAALRCLIEPGGDESEFDGAPWDYVVDVPEAFGLEADADERAIAAAVRDVVNQPDATVYLLGPDDYVADGGARGVFPPEYGETTDANWVFYVPLDALASLQWMIVDRSGERKAYCYGHD